MKKMTFYRFTKIIVCLLLVISGGCSKKPEPLKPPITIKFDVFPGYAHVFLAQSMGFFKKNGVEVVLEKQKDYLSVKKALDTGEADAVFIVYPDVIMANEHGSNYKVVYLCDYSLTSDVIIGQPELKSLADMKGKTISFEGVNSFSNIFVLTALENFKVREFEVRCANIRSSEVIKALQTGQIDAGHVWEPYKTRAIKLGYNVLAQAQDIPIGIIADTMAFKASLIKERPQEVYAIVKSIFEALEFTKKHPEEAMQVMADEEDISIEEITKGFNGVHHPDLAENVDILSSKLPPSLYTSGKLIMDFYLKRGQLSGVDFKKIEDILDPQFVEELSHKGGVN